MDTKTLPNTVMTPNYSYVFDFERDFEHEVTKGWFLVSFTLFFGFWFKSKKAFFGRDIFGVKKLFFSNDSPYEHIGPVFVKKTPFLTEF